MLSKVVDNIIAGREAHPFENLGLNIRQQNVEEPLPYDLTNIGNFFSSNILQ